MSPPCSRTFAAMRDRDPLPSAHQIRAACRVAQLLTAPSIRVDDAAQAYRSSSSGGRFSERDLLHGQELLISVGMVSIDGGTLEVSDVAETLARLDGHTATLAVLSRLLERRPPLWLSGAAGGSEVRRALIPDDSRTALESLLENEAHMDALLLSAARRIDELPLRGFAEAACTCVASACRRQLTDSDSPELAAEVQVVGALGHELGYDVLAPTLGGPARRLAVRAARASGWRTAVSLSRTEIEVGLADPAWALVVCEVQPDGGLQIAGWCVAAQLEVLLPADRHSHGRWVHAWLLLMQGALAPDLPPC